MPEIQKYSLVERLRESDERLQGSPSLLGMTALTYPNYINSMRSTMFTAHLKQFLNLEQPEFPYVFTNNENLVGKYSSGYKKAKHDLRVVRKIGKFADIVDEPRIYKLFIFDKEEKRFDVIERKVCESLTENFGYDYINDTIDAIQEGDEIPKDTVMYRSTSYDEDMNYAYGQNVVVAYTLDPYTSEDAAIASKSLQKKMTSIEVEEITLGLNSNDYLVNMNGDKHHYKPLPDIGEYTSDEFCRSRRLFNNQILHDFKDSSLRECYDSDQVYYCDKDVEVIDYTIYDNREERKDDPFYEQINKYYDSQTRYYQDIYDTCKEIMESGYEYSRELDYTYKKAKEMLDHVDKWHDGDNEFGNIKVEVTIKRLAPLAKGSKVTGRSGNKSVISAVWEDEDMPFTDDGRRVDLILNLLAIINRTTAAPLYEMLINGSAYQVRQKMQELETLGEKEQMLFDFIEIFNEDQYMKMHKHYKSLKKKEKEEYIQDAIDNGIYIHWTPMWEKIPIFYRCQNLFVKFPFIKENNMYVRKWGRPIRCLNKYFTGEQYIL